MIIGTAGHVDHGKTALVRALTGVDADRLKEEKARGMTIDLGYAYAPLPSGEILGFVDVPGHERFLHNMLAGAIGIDFALLVVAADEGPMPQTREHLRILDLLGLHAGALALTMIDRVEPERLEAAVAGARELLAGTGLAAAPVFPVSSRTGEGLAVLRDHLAQATQGLRGRPCGGGFRLAVDRGFTIPGTGTVVTGTVFSGRVQLGDRLVVSPREGRPTRVRGIHAQNREALSAGVGERCALNLADVPRDAVQRGDWILEPRLHRPTRRLDARIRLLAESGARLRSGTALHLHLGTARVTGRLLLLEQEELEPGAEALAQLALDQPVAAARGDRLILRDGCARHTLGGGRVLDPAPPLRSRRTPARLAMLAALERDEPAGRLAGVLEASPEGLNLTDHRAAANLTDAELERALAGLAVTRVAGTALAFTPAHWAQRLEDAVAALAREHAETPDSPGLNLAQFRLRASPRLPREAFVALLDQGLAAGRLDREGAWWFLPGHRVSLSEQEEALWRLVAAHLAEQAFQPPRVRDLARLEGVEETVMRLLLHKAARAGRVYRVARDHFFARAAVAALADIVRGLAAADHAGAIRAAEFRDRIGTGRKLAIQILEFFDRAGLTRRIRDEHRLRDGGAGF